MPNFIINASPFTERFSPVSFSFAAHFPRVPRSLLRGPLAGAYVLHTRTYKRHSFLPYKIILKCMAALYMSVLYMTLKVLKTLAHFEMLH